MSILFLTTRNLALQRASDAPGARGDAALAARAGEQTHGQVLPHLLQGKNENAWFFCFVVCFLSINGYYFAILVVSSSRLDWLLTP
jgi:hypothetical protein